MHRILCSFLLKDREGRGAYSIYILAWSFRGIGFYVENRTHNCLVYRRCLFFVFFSFNAIIRVGRRNMVTKNRVTPLPIRSPLSTEFPKYCVSSGENQFISNIIRESNPPPSRLLSLVPLCHDSSKKSFS